MHDSSPGSAHHFYRPTGALRGRIRIPGDKSISHRAIMLSALAVGTSSIRGVLESEDTIATANAMRAMGASVEQVDSGHWRVDGVGIGTLLQPETELQMGNSGTTTRLLMGLVASHPITAAFTGDASLSRRPMGRIIDPLSQMGAQFTTSKGGCLPLIEQGTDLSVPITYRLPVASAQVKSAILLAGLNTRGTTTVVEPVPTRDHSERMLKGFGANLIIDMQSDGARAIHIHGPTDLVAQDLEVPGDISSAAFFIVGALITPGSKLTIENVGINPTRIGLITALRAMGGRIDETNCREVGGEPVADLVVYHSPLQGTDLDPALAPLMIDEYPVLFVAASTAKGRTVTSGLEELRVKESDRLSVMANALKTIGANVEERKDGLVIDGTDGTPLIGTPPDYRIETHLDHRIAMTMAIAALVCRDGIAVDDIRPIATSFPNFNALLEEACNDQ